MTEDPHSLRRLRKAFAASSPGDAPTPDCPPAEQIWNGVVSALAPGDLRRILDHVAVCPVCTEAWRLASEIAGDEASTESSGALDEDSDEPVRSSRVGWVSAAAAVFAFVVFTTAYDFGAAGGSVSRAGGRAATLLGPATPATEGGCGLEWTPVTGAIYDVQLLNQRLELLGEWNGLAEPRFVVAESVLRELDTSSDLRLYVAARRGPDGVVADATFELACRDL